MCTATGHSCLSGSTGFSFSLKIYSVQIYVGRCSQCKRQGYPCNKLWKSIGLWDNDFLDSRLTDGGEVSLKIPGAHFLEAQSNQGHSVAGRIRWIVESNDRLGHVGLWKDELAMGTTFPGALWLSWASFHRFPSFSNHPIKDQGFPSNATLFPFEDGRTTETFK
jgi:hypothetical protein